MRDLNGEKGTTTVINSLNFFSTRSTLAWWESNAEAGRYIFFLITRIEYIFFLITVYCGACLFMIYGPAPTMGQVIGRWLVNGRSSWSTSPVISSTPLRFRWRYRHAKMWIQPEMPSPSPSGRIVLISKSKICLLDSNQNLNLIKILYLYQ